MDSGNYLKRNETFTNSRMTTDHRHQRSRTGRKTVPLVSDHLLGHLPSGYYTDRMSSSRSPDLVNAEYLPTATDHSLSSRLVIDHSSDRSVIDQSLSDRSAIDHTLSNRSVIDERPSSIILSSDYPPMKRNTPLEPLYIQTTIFEDAFGHGKRNSLTVDQINQLTAALALPEKCLRKEVSPTTSSSGFGSTDDQLCSPVSPKTDTGRDQNKVAWFHFWLVHFVQYFLQYFREISIRAKRRLDHTPSSRQITVHPNILKIPPERGGFDLKCQRVTRAIRKLTFDEEENATTHRVDVSSKPYYTELHLGRENQRLTTLAAVEADQSIYPARKLIDKALETKYVTTVFEIRYRGLEEIADSLNEEVQRWYGEHDGVMIVCCELQWSTPDRYRDINREVRMKDDLMKCLRVNNHRVLDTVAKRNEKAKALGQYIVLPDSVTEEVVGRNLSGGTGCFGGSYRRYYAGLVPWGHQEAADEHQPWWEFKQHTMPESINWPLIASRDKISAIMVNLVCLKLGRL